MPDEGVEIGIAVAGERAIAGSRRSPTTSSASSPRPTLVDGWNAVEGAPQIGDGARAIGQIPICWDPDRGRRRWRRRTSSSAGSAAAGRSTPTCRPPRASPGRPSSCDPRTSPAAIPCGPDLDAVVEAVSAYWKVGFTDIALVQIGDDGQDRFLEEAAGPLLEKLRAAAPA